MFYGTLRDYSDNYYEPINWKKLYKHYGKKKIEKATTLQIMRWDIIHKIYIPKSLRKLIKIAN